MEQKNLFGEFQEVIEKPIRGYKAVFMQRHYRESTDKKNKSCKVCNHCVYVESAKRYYKCKMISMSASQITDIRLKNVCDLFIKKVE
jgi:hypothetical protein